MLFRQKMFALAIGIAIFFSILEMVRRRKLREEYSWLWLATGCGIIVLVLWYDLLVIVTEFIGAMVPTTTLFLFGVVFLMLIALHYSVKISTLTDQVERLAQEMAILREQYDERWTRYTQGSAEHEQGRHSSS